MNTLTQQYLNEEELSLIDQSNLMGLSSTQFKQSRIIVMTYIESQLDAQDLLHVLRLLSEDILYGLLTYRQPFQPLIRSYVIPLEYEENYHLTPIYLQQIIKHLLVDSNKMFIDDRLDCFCDGRYKINNFKAPIERVPYETFFMTDIAYKLAEISSQTLDKLNYSLPDIRAKARQK